MAHLARITPVYPNLFFCSNIQLKHKQNLLNSTIIQRNHNSTSTKQFHTTPFLSNNIILIRHFKHISTNSRCKQFLISIKPNKEFRSNSQGRVRVCYSITTYNCHLNGYRKTLKKNIQINFNV